jgi:monoamine oxidase
LVDQFSAGDPPGLPRIYRVVGGADRIAAALAEPLSDRLKLSTELVAISQRGARVRATLRHRRQAHQFTCDYLVCTLPAPILRRVPITPALPAQQHDAIATLKYGRATKSLLQFSSRFWRVPRKPSAYGSALPFGAVWDGNEEQRGKPAILALLAGGGASDWTIGLVGREGAAGLAKHLAWLGSSRAQLLHAHHVSWELDPFARGGYAFFDPSFPPARRSWLAQPSGRLFFAGEHTSLRWQGYMTGAVESGRRAAAEVAATHALLAAAGRTSWSRR